MESFHANNNAKNIINFESQLDKDLQQTQGALINHLIKHSLLSNGDIAPMD